MEVRYIMIFLGVYHRNLSNDKADFAIVQEKLKSRQRPGQSGEPSMFAGLREVADRPLYQRQAPAADLFLQDLQRLREAALQPAPN